MFRKSSSKTDEFVHNFIIRTYSWNSRGIGAWRRLKTSFFVKYSCSWVLTVVVRIEAPRPGFSLQEAFHFFALLDAFAPKIGKDNKKRFVRCACSAAGMATSHVAVRLLRAGQSLSQESSLTWSEPISPTSSLTGSGRRPNKLKRCLRMPEADSYHGFQLTTETKIIAR